MSFGEGNEVQAPPIRENSRKKKIRISTIRKS